MQLSDKQNLAIEMTTDLKRRVVAVTGPAGSGKTTIMKMGVESLRKQGRKVALAAPTGRAARRIMEATGYPAVTIHKLLEYGKPEIDADTGLPIESTRPGRTREKPLGFQDVLVDEYMMVNEELHRNLIDALPPGGRLIAFGDVHQLPPIEQYELTGIEGAPFEQILQNKKSSVTLDIVFRQSGDSGILYNAHRVRSGLPPVANADFSIKVTDVPIFEMAEHVKEAFGVGIDYSTMDHQIISPARQGKMGTHALNAVLQGIFHPGKHDAVELPRDKWAEKYPIDIHVGEKVICNENIYDMRDFFERFRQWEDDHTPVWSSYIPCPDPFFILNGEVGIVRDVLPDGSLSIELADRMVQMPSSYRDFIPRYNRIYSRDPRKKIDLGYAITTHKMQGSECETVCYLMNSVCVYQINRNNIYTALTRAKKRVHLITDQRCLLNGMRMTAAQKAKVQAEQKTRKGWSIEA